MCKRRREEVVALVLPRELWLLILSQLEPDVSVLLSLLSVCRGMAPLLLPAIRSVWQRDEKIVHYSLTFLGLAGPSYAYRKVISRTLENPTAYGPVAWYRLLWYIQLSHTYQRLCCRRRDDRRVGGHAYIKKYYSTYPISVFFYIDVTGAARPLRHHPDLKRMLLPHKRRDRPIDERLLREVDDETRLCDVAWRQDPVQHYVAIWTEGDTKKVPKKGLLYYHDGDQNLQDKLRGVALTHWAHETGCGGAAEEWTRFDELFRRPEGESCDDGEICQWVYT